jgi:VanZ family protein
MERVLERASAYTSSAAPLAWVYAAVILYASLFPFEGWRWPAGQGLAALATLPWPPWRDPFDVGANVGAYVPLGLLVAMAQADRARSVWAIGALTLILAGALSYGAEVLQNFLPNRHPSLKDWAMNVLGSAVGLMMALLLSRLGAGAGWRHLRRRWFLPHSGGALALLALWPLSLLPPSPLPLALGQWGQPLMEAALALVRDVPWADPLAEMLRQGLAEPPVTRSGPWREGLTTALGLLAPCMLMYAVSRPGWHRALLSLGALGLAVAAMTMSTVLNFGPQNAWTWLTASTPWALSAGIGVAGVLLFVPPRVAAGLGLVALGAAVALVAGAPDDPYFAQNLQRWEQGRFIHFHGIGQWLAWIWPYAAMLALFAALARRLD